MSMACACAIVAFGDPAGALPRIVEAAPDELDRIDRLTSDDKTESPVSRFDRGARVRWPTATIVEPTLVRRTWQ